jgi:hypothetical protein
LIYIPRRTFTLGLRRNKPALEFIRIKCGKYTYNIDEKGCRIACTAGEEVVIPIGRGEMYVRVPENRLSVTVVESISADGKAIAPLVIVPGRNIMVSWYHANITGQEIVAVSPSGYTNEEICLRG